MAATASAKLNILLDGLAKTLDLPYSWNTSTTPTKYYHGRQVQAEADAAEALELGNISTPLLVVISCVTNDCAVDTTYVSSFVEELTVNEGEVAVFTPKGTVYIKNNDSSEATTIDVFAVGT